MRYVVTINDFGPAAQTSGPLERRIGNLSLSKAWHLATRASRQGLRLYGGSIVRYNWGASGGSLARTYRSATIRVQS